MFEHSLIQSQRKSRRTWLSLPVAILIHFVVLGSVAFANYWSVTEVAEPDLNVVFLATAPPPPPPPPPPGGGNRPIPTRPEPVPEPEKPQVETVQPDVDDIPEEIPETRSDLVNDLAPADSGSPGGEPGGVPGGVPNGVPGGVVGSTGAVGGIPGGLGTGGGGGAADDQPIRFSAEMTRPVAIHQVAPRYTSIAIKAAVQGVVIVDAVIDEQGNVTNVRVLRGLPMGLDRAAVEAVSQWRFTPAKLGGKPVKVIFTLTVNFTIQR